MSNCEHCGQEGPYKCADSHDCILGNQASELSEPKAELDRLVGCSIHFSGPGKYLVSWKGSCRVPQFKIGGQKVQYMRDGIITTCGEEPHLGEYTRILDCDGPNGDRNQIGVTCKPTLCVSN